MTTKQYAPGATIIAEGTTGTQTYLIKEGRVLICKETGGPTGRIPIATLKEGEVFGEMYLMDEAGYRTASVVTQTQVTVEIIDQEQMQEYLAQTPDIVRSMIRTLSSRLAQTSQENSIMRMHENQTPLGRLLRRLTN
jgi:CRP/FNR family cyclic AMP-dependent transcriptional regulator